MSRLNVLREQNRGLTEAIATELKAKLDGQTIRVDVSSREKKPYSIWLKMQNKQISLEQLSDIYGFRVIVPTIQDCYAALGAVHTTWRVVPGRFKDYISTPKHNDYQSIHTTIVGPRHQRVELQIRTAEMHQIAEYGVAAHSGYKLAATAKLDGDAAHHGLNGATPNESSAYQWLRKLVDNLLEGDNPQEFLEHTKLELFLDQVFCFTPKGRLIALPRGANAIDFAYAVHTDVGNHCVGVKINGRHMPLFSELKNGDEVEIILSDAQTPPAAWEGAVITGKARSAIRRATKDAVRKQYLTLGRDIVKAAIQRAGRSYADTDLTAALPRLGQKTVEDLLTAVGRGETAADEVLAVVDPDFVQHAQPKRRTITRNDDGWFNLRRVTSFKFRWPGRDGDPENEDGRGIPIRGVNGISVIRFADGGAVPGERIVGILDPGEGITIYPIHSPHLRDFEEQLDRWIDVTWDIQEGATELFPARIRVTALNEPGSLGQIASMIGSAGANIDRLQMVTRARDYTDMLIDVEVLDLKHLTDIINGVKSLNVVSTASRILT